MHCTTVRKALIINYEEHITNIELYGSLLRISKVLLSRRLRFAGHCVRRTDQLVSDLVLWQPTGTLIHGGHVRMTFLRRLLKDTSLSAITELHSIMLEKNDWRSVISGLASVA